MMLTTGCQEIKLKAGIEAANKQCPIDMGETGKITSIVYDGENVVYTFYLNEEAANIKTLQKNPESMKTSLKIMFQNPNKEVKSLLDLVVKCLFFENCATMNPKKIKFEAPLSTGKPNREPGRPANIDNDYMYILY